MILQHNSINMKHKLNGGIGKTVLSSYIEADQVKLDIICKGV